LKLEAMSSRAWALAAVVVLVVGLATAAVIELTASRGSGLSQCRVSVDAARFVLEPDQATNATTIAAVGKRLGLPDHAVTIALAAALQESGLHNLDHGDRDSLGLFQQRPSQGWGTPEQILTPAYAAQKFFEHLARVTGWETLAVTDAAQRVQRSGAPSAYAQWEPEARALARAITGEVPAAFVCHAPTPRLGVSAGALNAVVTSELGSPGLGTPLTSPRGWTVASWLVGHSSQFGITSVSFEGRTWTPSDGSWQPRTPATSDVRVELAGSS
jgi:hypothetical protein